MAYILGDNIISPLGKTSVDNYLAVKAGQTGLCTYGPGSRGIPEGFTASLINDNLGESPTQRFKRLVLDSARDAIGKSGPEFIAGESVFILSTTKGNIEDLGKGYENLGETAKRISSALGICSEPIVVCNACVSGLSALILAGRLLDMGAYRYAVVCGCDIPDRFVISGFQSLKALSAEACRPFDIDRYGLNLGEAAATIVLSSDNKQGVSQWQIMPGGSVRNDAFHISAPSKSADGAYFSLSATLTGKNIEGLACINAHGTATLFNDQMESVAIQRAGLGEIPVNALKGYFGHTLGAAGVLETIITMHSIDDGIILGTKGFSEPGVSGKININSHNQPTDKHSFVKMLSGFGGCNASVVVERNTLDFCGKQPIAKKLTIQHRVEIAHGNAKVDGKEISVEWDGNNDLLTAIYKTKIADYPKFYKMDSLSRLAFVASELLLQSDASKNGDEPCCNRAVVLFNHSSSICADKKYLDSVNGKDGYFPSPSVFVYTLPNIATGEIAIRNNYHGETSFYILPDNAGNETMQLILKATFEDKCTDSIVGGWVNYDLNGDYYADLAIYTYE